jgi:hypothetical protein
MACLDVDFLMVNGLALSFELIPFEVEFVSPFCCFIELFIEEKEEEEEGAFGAEEEEEDGSVVELRTLRGFLNNELELFVIVIFEGKKKLN